MFNVMFLVMVFFDGQFSLCIVLLKYFDNIGFVFFINYESKKVKDIVVNVKVVLYFLWLDFEWQVKIMGWVECVSIVEFVKYFFSWLYGSQLGAWVFN